MQDIEEQIFIHWINDFYGGPGGYEIWFNDAGYHKYVDSSEEKLFPREESNRLGNNFHELGIDGRIDLLLMYYAENSYNPKLTVEQREVINYIFSPIYPRVSLNAMGREPNLRYETLSIMLEENLIRSTGKDETSREFVPTSKGYRINEQGGWLKYRESEGLKEQEINNDRILTREVGNSSKRTNNVQIISAVGTLLIIGYGVYLQRENNQLTKYNQDSDKEKSQQLLLQQNLQQQVNYYQQQSDSLKIQVGKLQKQLQPKGKAKK